MKTLTLAPCKITKRNNNLETSSFRTILSISATITSSHYHGFWWKIGRELGTNNAAVTVRPSHLTPNAAIVTPILLHFGLVDISHTLASIPPNLLLGVHSLNLDQGCVGVLVWLGPDPSPPSNIQTIYKSIQKNSSPNFTSWENM